MRRTPTGQEPPDTGRLRSSESFEETLAEACEKSAWEVYAWVLMDKHYHLALRTPAGNLVEGMKWFQNTYTRRFNTRHRQWGHLYGGRYKSILVDGEARPGEPGDLATLVDYIHLNYPAFWAGSAESLRFQLSAGTA